MQHKKAATKVLDYDDALELFTKILPDSASVIKVQGSSVSIWSRALATLQAAFEQGLHEAFRFVPGMQTRRPWRGR